MNTNPDSYYNIIKGLFSTNKTAEYRKMAFIGSIPKWKGFSLVNEEIQQMTATDAIVKLENAMYCLSRVWVEESGNFFRKQPSQFDARKVRGFTSSSIYVVHSFSESMIQKRITLIKCSPLFRLSCPFIWAENNKNYNSN